MAKLNEIEKDALDSLFLELAIHQKTLFEKITFYCKNIFK